MTPRTVETAFNLELANQLRARHPRWREESSVAAEQTGWLTGKAGKRPDIIIRHPGSLPVIVETEFSPARHVEREAVERLGETIDGQQIEGVLAVRVSAALARIGQEQLPEAINTAQFEYCLLSGSGDDPERWPAENWLSGGIDQVAEAIEHGALSKTRLARASLVLQEGVEGGAALLRSHLTLRPDMFINIGRILHQEDSVQTTRMAVAIIANAFVFQSAICGNHDIPPPEDLRTNDPPSVKIRTQDCWLAILAINYWPIFAIARELLGVIPAAVANPFLDKMIGLAGHLAGLGAASMHDLSGQMFQRLITDRKFLATFYTLPTSSALLANLAISRIAINWGDSDKIAQLRIADLACGTGSLLGAAQQAVAKRHRRAGGDDRELHGHMMEDVLIAADIMPAATHLTASTLSSAHPGQVFAGTQIYTMPYGLENDEVQIGSLDLILDNQAMSLFGEGNIARAGGTRETRGQMAVINRETCDLVIMNPPFTRPTNHEQTGVPIPSFAGFATPEDEQRLMSDRLRNIREELMRNSGAAADNGVEISPPAGHGNAGLAANFIDLAHAKLRTGGTLALVLPASFAQGEAWKRARNLLTQHYRDVVIIGIAAHGSTSRAFSADTGMAEVLCLATRNCDCQKAETNSFIAVSLRARPNTQLEGALVAEAIEAARRGNTKSGRLTLGDAVNVGSFLRTSANNACRAIGITHLNIAESLVSLAARQLRLPQMAGSLPIPMTNLGTLGRRGALDRDINGDDGRGPFDIRPIAAGEYPEWPALWSHNARHETRMIVLPDSQGIVRPDCGERAQILWDNTASRLHFNRDFQINSQPLAACVTEHSCIGGTAWPNFILSDPAWEPATLLWANSTLGLMSFWWHGTRQQQGRSRVTLSRLPELLMFDVRELSEVQIESAEGIFQRFQTREFLPANEAYRDETRHQLDEAVLVELLGIDGAVLDSLRILREQWCHEPSVHGGKSTAPN
ncbi:MAG: hypothetical protein OXF74_06485 [Rhodobacteraceae bacterium]|nr:hypothetical protein [Paracoccaceae bacterium]